MVRKNFLHKLVCEVAMRVFCQIVLQTTLSFREKVLTHSKVKYDLIALERERESYLDRKDYSNEVHITSVRRYCQITSRSGNNILCYNSL